MLFRSWANSQQLEVFFLSSILICIFVPIFHWIMRWENLGVHDSLKWRVGVSIPALIVALGAVRFRGWREWLIELQTVQVSAMVIGMVWVTGLASFHPYYLTACLLGIVGASLTLITFYQVVSVYVIGLLAVLSFYLWGPHNHALFPFFYFFSLLTIAGTLAALKTRAHAQEYQLRRSLHDALEELKVEKSKTFAQAQLTFLGELAANLAHEVNNPLTVFHGALELIQNELSQKEPDRDRLRTMIDRCFNQTRRLKALIENMLYFAGNRYQSGGSRSAAELIETALSLGQSYGDRFGVRVYCEVAPEKVFLESSYRDVLQSLFHLLRNAIEAVAKPEIPEGERWIRIRAQTAEDGKEYRIFISDSGQGISPAVQARLFAPFVVGAEKKGHIGLGLSTSKSILEHCGGKVSYLNEEPQTTFLVTFPVQQGPKG